ncbi:unnamed protein product [Adineta steineri]|uniref:Solute-binding protein family 3/N-terminal domain-containing protein n=1 Tax=Adineta steineri TaxID=433720 RepID=A0A818RRX2_9BILA|nr:unnamed protein product [Adineta steineri]
MVMDKELEENQLELQDMSCDNDQQYIPLATSEQEQQLPLKSRQSRTFLFIQRRTWYTTLLTLFIVGGVLAIAISSYKAYNKHNVSSDNQEMLTDSVQDNNLLMNEEDSEDDNELPQLRSASRKSQQPESLGHMNVYVRRPSKDGIRHRPQSLRFPVARYNRQRFPLNGPFLTFNPRLPIFVDRLTKQTIIFSPAGGIYILPPLINFYGKMFSVAELIVSGYASLVSTGAPLTPPINMLSYFQPTPLFGPGIPRINPSRGGFTGGIKTDYKSFNIRKHPQQHYDTLPTYESEEESEEKSEEAPEERYDPPSKNSEENYNTERSRSRPRPKYRPRQKPKSRSTSRPSKTTSKAPCSSNCDNRCTQECLANNFRCTFNSKTINIVTARDQPPFVSQVGNKPPTGFDIDLMKAIGDVLDINFKYQYADFPDFISMVQNDKDLISISTESDNAAREKNVTFAQYFKTGTNFLVRSSYTKTINGLSDLCGKKVAVLTGTSQESDVETQNAKCGSKKITISSLSSYPDMLTALEDETVDVLVEDQAINFANVLKSHGKVKEVGEVYGVGPYGILCNKNNEELCCAFVNAINYLIKKGTYEELLQKYSYTYATYGIYPSRINLAGSTCRSKCVPKKPPPSYTSTPKGSCSANCDSGCTEECLRDNFRCTFNSKTINVVTARDEAPFVSQVGNKPPTGFDIDLLDYIADIYNIKFSYQYADFSDFISMVQNDKDLISISTETDTAAREKNVSFAQFFKSGTSFLVRSSYTETINGLSDLCGKKVAVLTGTTQESDVTTQNAQCGSNPITINSFVSEAELVTALEDETVDVVLDDDASIIADIQNSNGQLKKAGTTYDIAPYGILCNKNNEQLCCALVNAINYLISEGTYAKLLEKYGYTSEDNGIYPSRINLSGSTCFSKCVPKNPPSSYTSTPKGSCSANCNNGCTEECLRDNLKCTCDLKSKTINIVTAKNQPPFVSQVGNKPPTGFDIDLMKAIGDVLDINFKYQYADFPDFISMVQNDKDLISISTESDNTAREKNVTFAQYFKTGTNFLVRSSYTKTINGLSDLCGKKVAVLTGTSQESDVETQNAKCGSKKITISSLSSYPDMLTALEDETVDVLVEDQAINFANVLKSHGKVKEVGEVYGVGPYGILCNKNNEELCCALVNAINYLIKKGTYGELLKKYSYTYANNGVCPSRINLAGSLCESKCTPSNKRCQWNLG